MNIKKHFIRKKRLRKRIFQRRSQCRKLSGMITIETACVTPLILFMILAVLYMALYYIDLGKVYEAVGRVVSYASISMDNDADIVTGNYSIKVRNSKNPYSFSHKRNHEICGKVKQKIREEIHGRLLILDEDQIDVSIKHNRIELMMKGVGQRNIWDYFHSGKGIHSYCAEYEIGNWAEYIRKVEVQNEWKRKVE